MKRVAAYCRVSTDHRDQANSFESQQRYFKERIEREAEWQLVGVYADEGISGTQIKKRTAFNAMVQAAHRGEIDLILTKEVSRFARNTVDTLRLTRELRQKGIGVLFLLDNIDTLQADGELRLTLMASLAQEESRRTSERVRWGQTERMKQGVVFGGSLLGYRVSHGSITVEPKGAALVRRIFHMYTEDGMGAERIARLLNQEGEASSRGKVSWSAATVLKILKNEKYVGDLVQKKTWTPDFLTHVKKYNHGEVEQIQLKDHHEPIVERALFERAQWEMARRRRSLFATGTGTDTAFSGKIRCGVCGKAFVRRKKGAVPYTLWRCPGEKGRPCSVGMGLREEDAVTMLRQVMDYIVPAMEVQTDRLEELLQKAVAAVRQRKEQEQLEEQRQYAAAEKLHRLGVERYVRGEITVEELALIRRETSRERLPAAETEPCPELGPLLLRAREQLTDLIVSSPEILLEYIKIGADGRICLALHGMPHQFIFKTPN